MASKALLDHHPSRPTRQATAQKLLDDWKPRQSAVSPHQKVKGERK